jgi:choline dehydrogenase
MHLIPYSIKDPKRRKLQDFPSMTVACYQLRPESLYSVTSSMMPPMPST